MAVIADLLVKMGLDPAGFRKGERETEREIGKLEKRLKSMDKVATAVGAGAGLAFAAGFMKSMDVDAGQKRLAAQLDLTGKEAERIGKISGKVFAENFGESTDAVNDALKSVIQNMDGMRSASDAALTDVTKRALTLADTMGEDVSKVTASVSQMLRTGLAPNAKTAFDVLQRGAALGANKAEDLLDTFNEYPTQFRDLGLSAQQAMGIMVQGLQAGARDSDLVADALKELNIRVRDMSAAPALKELGLSAKDMSAAFGKGGPVAAKALDTIFDRLRRVKDPTKQYALAQQLLGTQSEDMAKALMAIDPSRATAKLGQFAGANQRAMDTMGKSASSNIETFKRQMTTSFVNFLGNTVIPMITKFMSVMNSLGISPDTLVALGVAFAALAVSVKIANAAILFFTETAVGMAIASKAATAAQWLWNAALSANPIGLVIIGIVALVAIVVVCYKKFAWFRAGVQFVWQSIVTVAKWAWENILKPIFKGIQVYISIVVAYYKILWNIAKMVWSGIVAAAQFAWKVIQPIFKIIAWYISNIVVPQLKILLFVAKLVWWGIHTNLMIMWKIVKSIWNNFVTVIKTFVLPVLRFLFNVVKSGLTTFIINPFKLMLSWVKWAWNGFISAGKRAWAAISPVFSKIRDILSTTKRAFSSAISAIAKSWDGLRAATRKPVSYVINTVYTHGIKALWDRVAKLVHLPTMPSAPKFASGGRITGPGGPRTDSIPISASAGEYMVQAKRTRLYMPLLNAINYGSHFDVLNSMGMVGDPGRAKFADGGIIGAVKGFFGKAKGFFAGGFMKAARAALNPMISATSAVAGSSPYGQMVTGVVRKVVGGVLSRFLPFENSIGGGSANGVVRAARTQIGVPYVWGGTAWGKGLDCSGLTSEAWQRGAKKWIGRTTYDQIARSHVLSGPRPAALGFPHSGHVVMYTEKGRVIQAPFTGARVYEGPISRHYQWRWPNVAGSFDTGYGSMEPGWNLAYNGTGRTETLRRTSSNGGDSAGLTLILENHGAIGSKSELRSWFQDMYEDAKRRGRVP